MNRIKGILGLLGLLAAGCASPALTESQEYFVGRGVAAKAIQDASLHPDQALEEYVSLIGWTIAFESDRPETYQGYHFGVLKSDAVNAFAAPSGFVFVTTGALKAMKSEDELAGVLAHEIAHVNLRHPEAAANRAAKNQGAMDALSWAGKILISNFVKQDNQEIANQLLEAFGPVIGDVLKECFFHGREDELKADAAAVDYLTRSGVGYDPNALREFIARLPKGDRGAWSTHPELEDRVNVIEGEIKNRASKNKTHAARTQRFMKMTEAIRSKPQ